MGGGNDWAARLRARPEWFSGSGVAGRWTCFTGTPDNESLRGDELTACPGTTGASCALQLGPNEQGSLKEPGEVKVNETAVINRKQMSIRLRVLGPRQRVHFKKICPSTTRQPNTP